MEKVHKQIFEAGRRAALLDMHMPEEKFHNMIASHRDDSMRSNIIRSGYNKGGNGIFDTIGNEITNPQSTLRSTLLPQLPNEIINPRSELRRNIIPTAGYISNYTYYVDPTPVSTIINATDKVNNVATALQTGEYLPEAVADLASTAAYHATQLPLPANQKATMAALSTASKATASYIKKIRKGGKGKRGLYANIQAKRNRIKKEKALGLPVEKMRKPGTKGAPTKEAFEKSALTAK